MMQCGVKAVSPCGPGAMTGMSTVMHRSWRRRAASAVSANWIISGPGDLVLLTGPVVIGYVFLYFNIALGVSSFLIWWFWEVSVNGAHLFATLSRTYLDRQEWRERGGTLLIALLWIGLGPLALVIDDELDVAVATTLFFFFQLSWGYYHVVRQLYGILCLYQKKNGEPSGVANKSEYWLFHTAMFVPFLVWMLRYPTVGSILRIPNLAAASDSVVHCLEGVVVVSVIFYLGIVVTGGLYAKRLNLPKAIFLIAYFSLHTVATAFLPAPYAFDVILVNAVLTYPHNVQYLAIVWHYNKKHYTANRENFGAAGYVNRNLASFIFFSTLFGLSFLYAWWYFMGLRVPFLPSVSSLAREPLYGGRTVGQFVQVIAIGIILNHYYLDQKIWRVNRDPRVGKVLGV
jgi:hypothetical protein